MEIVNLILLIVLIFLVVILLIKTKARDSENTLSINKKDKDEIVAAFSSNVTLISNALQVSAENSSKEVKANLGNT